MTKYEYKTVILDQKGGVLRSRTVSDLESTLNREGKEGWRLCEIIQPSGPFGESNVIVIFERVLK